MIGSDEKIEKIRKIAFDMFLEIGYEATTIRMICKEAGIESPTLYYFFQSKKGLFLDVRRSLAQEYQKQVDELSLDNEKSPEDALKKYYMFCINYAEKNIDKTRFYLRYRMFKPVELKEEIEDYINESLEERKLLYGKYLQVCINLHKIDYPLDEAIRKYNNFINNGTFNIIFSQWEPTEEEKDIAWDLFYNYYLINKR